MPKSKKLDEKLSSTNKTNKDQKEIINENETNVELNGKENNAISGSGYIKSVEDKRVVFLEQYRKFKLWNNIILVVSMAIIIVAFIVFFTFGTKDGNQWGLWAAIGTVGAILIGMFFYSRYMKSKMNNLTQIYIRDLAELMSEFTFPKKDYSSKKIEYDEKISLEEFSEGGAYVNMRTVRGRNVTYVTRNGKEYKVSDQVAQFIPEGQKHGSLTVAFAGKFIETSNEIDILKEDEIVFIYVPGGPNLVVPNGFIGTKTVESNKHYSILSNSNNWNKLIHTKTETILKKFVVDNVFLDMTIAIRKGKTYVYMNYEDSLLILPLQQPYNADAIKEYKADIKNLTDLLVELHQ